MITVDNQIVSKHFLFFFTIQYVYFSGTISMSTNIIIIAIHVDWSKKISSDSTSAYLNIDKVSFKGIMVFVSSINVLTFKLQPIFILKRPTDI